MDSVCTSRLSCTFIRREEQIYFTDEHSRSMAGVVDTRQRCGAATGSNAPIRTWIHDHGAVIFCHAVGGLADVALPSDRSALEDLLPGTKHVTADSRQLDMTTLTEGL